MTRSPTNRTPIYGKNDNERNKIDNGWVIGKRLERILFAGVLLTGLCFVELYMVTADIAYSRDSETSAIDSFLEGLERNTETLSILFNKKPEAVTATRPEPVISPSATEKHARAIAASRMKLGLPPVAKREEDALEPQANTQQRPLTYTKILEDIVTEAENQSHASKGTLKQFINPSLSPDDLKKKAKDIRNTLENKPFSVWGIQSPRRIGVAYAGSNFELQYNFISIALISIISPFMAGWISMLYVTRQREIHAIRSERKLSIIFPHILNIIPVNYNKLSGKFPREIDKKFSVVVYAIIRMIIMALVISPMIWLHTHATFILWDFMDNKFIYMFFIVYTLLQGLLVIIQDGYFFKGVYFDEK